ncbi:MAG: ExeA family protein [Thiotrichales bacterium]
MYLKHFDLKRAPFQLRPDETFFYSSLGHARAKALLAYSVWNRDGIAVVTGEAGSGKTTLIRQALNRLPSAVTAMVIHQTQLDEIEFLKLILARFGIAAFAFGKAQLITELNRILFQQQTMGRSVLLLVDEAQHLDARVLEELRFLTGIQVAGKQVFNLILFGQPSLAHRLASPELRQFAQRVRLQYELESLSGEESALYIEHRLRLAGAPSEGLFEATAIEVINESAKGIPRLINVLGDAAMTAAFVDDSNQVRAGHVRTALEELGWSGLKQSLRSADTSHTNVRGSGRGDDHLRTIPRRIL